MICPKCRSKMKVTHTYSANDAGKTQRVACECGVVGTCVTIMVNTSPTAGYGAKSIADRLRLEKTPPSLVLASEDGADETVVVPGKARKRVTRVRRGLRPQTP